MRLKSGGHMTATQDSTTVNALEAAEIADRHRNTILNWLDKGRVEGDKNDSGEWEIPLSQVLRERHSKEFTSKTREGLEREWDAAYAYSVAGMLEAAREAYKEYQTYQNGDGNISEVDAKVVDVLEAADRVQAVRESRTIVEHLKRMAGGFLSNGDGE